MDFNRICENNVQITETMSLDIGNKMSGPDLTSLGQLKLTQEVLAGQFYHYGFNHMDLTCHI